MAKLTRSTVLVRAPELDIGLGSDGWLTVRVADRSFEIASFGLAVLDLFSVPHALQEAIELLSARCAGRADWIALTGVVEQLYRAGALREPGRARELSAFEGGYDAPGLQIRMLDDVARTTAYLEAIAETVRPGDVVVDIGTGTGVLSLAAARAGARRVYAIEASGAASMASSMFMANHVVDRVTLLRGWSSRIELPERAGVLVSELIGHEPLEEGVIEYTLDARERMLGPDPRLVPAAVTISLQPVTLPDHVRAGLAFLPETLERWGASYGFDFSPLGELPAPPTRRGLMRPTDPHEARGETREVARVDLAAISTPVVDAGVLLPITEPGRVDGILLTFALELSPSRRLVVAPGVASDHNHWKLPIWIFPRPRWVSAGDELSVRYRYEGRRARLLVDAPVIER